MYISKLVIQNFKIFKNFSIELGQGLNILVGNNNAGKSTIIEAINLALTGMYSGKQIRNELTQYFFNKDVVDSYFENLNSQKNTPVLPFIKIEIYFDGEINEEFKGNGNLERTDAAGICFNIEFDNQYKVEYENFIKENTSNSLPIEYYKVYWSSFSRDDSITPRSIPVKSALIDSSSNRFQNGSDVYISRIIKEFLESKELIEISQAHRMMKDSFLNDITIQKINSKLDKTTNFPNKSIEISVELTSKNAWENSLITLLDKIPFHFIGKGEQCLVKSKLALEHKKTLEANIILIEEPENHLSFSKLNMLISELKNFSDRKQILISTHSSFVANKLGLEYLILIRNLKNLRLTDLNHGTKDFFKKLPGYNTLRMLLSKKSILVEGDSDELIVQRAFLDKYKKLPIESEIDVISVGTSFLRFLEIADKLKIQTIVVTDNDGKIKKLQKKYSKFLDSNYNGTVKICFDETIDKGEISDFNYNTLEPKLLKSNSLVKFNLIFETNYKTETEMHKFMKEHKTHCALKIFESNVQITFPEYILKAIEL